MTTSDLKLKIFRQIDTMEKSKLEDLYGVFLNFINGQKDISDWEKLSEKQRQGIIDALDEIDSGKGKANNEVLVKYREKYSRA